MSSRFLAVIGEEKTNLTNRETREGAREMDRSRWEGVNTSIWEGSEIEVASADPEALRRQ